jgi:arylformamidase
MSGKHLTSPTIMKIIDLSIPINQGTPVYPGDPPVKIEQAGRFEKDGYVDHLLAFGTHTATHIDAPLHMIDGGKTLDQFPADYFVGRGVYIKINDGKFNLDTVKSAGIKPGDIVLFHTGLSDNFYDPEYWEIRSAMSEEIAEYLVSLKPKMVGLDTGGADTKGSVGHPIHKILLGADVLIIENLTNLGELAGKEFTVYALPIKLQIDGAPARVIAKIQD